MIFHTGAETDNATAIADIASVMETYFKSVCDADVDLLRSTFHVECRLAGYRGDETRYSSGESFVDRVTRRKPDDASNFRILTIDRAGRAGVAKIAYHYHGIDFEDYMSLLLTDEGWKIVAKVFSGVYVDESKTVD